MEGLVDILNSVANKSNHKSNRKDKHSPVEVDVSRLLVSDFQPRKNFDKGEIDNLAASIDQYGLINPIIVRIKEGTDCLEIIAGERRLRAVSSLGWKTVAVVIKDMTDRDAQAIALVENLQREDLNPLEEALGYLELLEKYGLTHEQVAKSVNKPRSTISNMIRLIELCEHVKDLINSKQLDLGHAKLLASLSGQTQIDLADKVVSGKLSVRQLEILIKKTLFKPTKVKAQRIADERFNDLAVYLKRRTAIDFDVEVSNISTNKILFSDEESYDKFVEFLIKL